MDMGRFHVKTGHLSKLAQEKSEKYPGRLACMQDFPNARSVIQLLCRSEQITRLFQFSLLSKDEKRTSFRSPKGIDEAKLSLI